MFEFWEWFDGYKIYSEEKSILNLLKKISGARVHSQYYKNAKLVAEDVIIPANRIEFVLEKIPKIKLL